jgi:hypothetical protein
LSCRLEPGSGQRRRQLGHCAKAPRGCLLDRRGIDSQVVGYQSQEFDQAHRIDNVGKASRGIDERWLHPQSLADAAQASY